MRHPAKSSAGAVLRRLLRHVKANIREHPRQCQDRFPTGAVKLKTLTAGTWPTTRRKPKDNESGFPVVSGLTPGAGFRSVANPNRQTWMPGLGAGFPSTQTRDPRLKTHNHLPLTHLHHRLHQVPHVALTRTKDTVEPGRTVSPGHRNRRTGQSLTSPHHYESCATATKQPGSRSCANCTLDGGMPLRQRWPESLGQLAYHRPLLIW